MNRLTANGQDQRGANRNLRQQRLENEHQDDDADGGQHAGDDLAEAFGEHLVDVLDVVGEAAHRFAVGPLVEEADRHRLEVGEELVAQVSTVCWATLTMIQPDAPLQ